MIALNKISSPKSLSNFQLISLLCFFSKILKRVVFNQIYTYVKSAQLIDGGKLGFLAGYSTATALLKLTDAIRRGKDRRLLASLVLFDLSKAFDTVFYVLLEKLYC